MTGYAGERIACCRRSDLPAGWLPHSGWVHLRWEDFLDGLAHAPVRFLERSAAEGDESLKQMIPYVLVRDRQVRLACYRRAGGEGRLHGQWSVGIGGHVAEQDCLRSAGSPWGALLLGCLHREIEEELGIRLDPPALRFLGLINEEVSAVGRVHLGGVWLLQVEETDSLQPGVELAGLEWSTPDALCPDRLELWSTLALGLMAATEGHV